MSSLDILTIRQYAFVVRLDIHHFCSSSLSANISGIGIINKIPPVELNHGRLFVIFGLYKLGLVSITLHYCNTWLSNQQCYLQPYEIQSTHAPKCILPKYLFHHSQEYDSHNNHHIHLLQREQND